MNKKMQWKHFQSPEELGVAEWALGNTLYCAALGPVPLAEKRKENWEDVAAVSGSVESHKNRKCWH